MYIQGSGPVITRWGQPQVSVYWIIKAFEKKWRRTQPLELQWNYMRNSGRAQK